MDRSVRFIVDAELYAIQEFALGTDPEGTFRSTLDEEWERIFEELDDGDVRDECDAILERARARTSEWWQDFPERSLLSELYRRAARRRLKGRKPKVGSSDSWRKPTHPEGLQVAGAMLARLPRTVLLDRDQERRFVTELIGLQLLEQSRELSRPDWLSIIRDSETRPAYFDALWRTCVTLSDPRQGFPVTLRPWLEEVVFGVRQRPPELPVAPHRPVTLGRVFRDFRAQSVIEVLRRVGVPAQGGPRSVSGCRIVGEALEIPEETVIRIWKNRPWQASFEKTLRSALDDLSEREGLEYDIRD